MKILSSPKNPELLEAARLLQASHRKDTGLFLLEGLKLVREARDAGLEIRKVFVTEPCAKDDPALCRDLEEAVPTFLLPGDLLKKVSTLETPEGIVAVGVQRWATPESAAAQLSSRDEFFGVVTDGVSDPGNLGSLIRTATAFGASFLFVLRGGITPYHPKVLRASMGAAFRLTPLHAPADELVRFSASLNFELVSTSSHGGESLHEFRFPARYALVFGSEAHGVSEAVAGLAPRALRIPIAHVESLGMAVSAGIILYEAARRRAPAS